MSGGDPQFELLAPDNDVQADGNNVSLNGETEANGQSGAPSSLETVCIPLYLSFHCVPFLHSTAFLRPKFDYSINFLILNFFAVLSF